MRAPSEAPRQPAERGAMKRPGAPRCRGQVAAATGRADPAAAGASPPRPAIEPVAAEVAERFLAPALRAAAAARARSARIRAATPTSPTVSRPRPTSAPRRPAPAPARREPAPAATPVTAAEAAAPAPGRARHAAGERARRVAAGRRARPRVPPRAGWTVSKAPALGGARPASGGSAACRSPRPRAPRPSPSGRCERTAPASADARRRLAPAPRAVARPPVAERRPPPAAAPAAAPASPTPPAQPPLPAEPALRERGEATRHQRFAKTIAELQRYQAASREREPGSDLVPRPTLPLEDRDAGGAWSWLWSRRKSGDARLSAARRGRAADPGERAGSCAMTPERAATGSSGCRLPSLVSSRCCRRCSWRPAASPGSRGAPEAALDRLRLPPGFAIAEFARVPGARSLLVAEDGARIYVATRDSEVFAILDPERDGSADEVVTVASGLKVPNGLALAPDGALLIAEQHRIIRLDGERRARIVVPAGVLPDRDQHGWRYAGLGPDGKLYVAVGAPCDVCAVRSLEGTIVRLRPDGHQLEVFARGVRNSLGFDWHPLTGELFFTDNGGDHLGDLNPPDELNRAPAPGLHFGFPYVYGDGLPYPQFAGQDPPQRTTPPALAFDANGAALGIDFYTGRMFPEDYRNDALVAQHGAGDRSRADRLPGDAGALRRSRPAAPRGGVHRRLARRRRQRHRPPGRPRGAARRLAADLGRPRRASCTASPTSLSETDQPRPRSLTVWSRAARARATSSSISASVMTSGGARTMTSRTARITRPCSTQRSRQARPTRRAGG